MAGLYVFWPLALAVRSQKFPSPLLNRHHRHHWLPRIQLAAADQHLSSWAAEVNEKCASELAAVARAWSPAIEGEWERLAHVEIVDVNEEGFEIDEVLCSSMDDRCIALKVPVDWPRRVTSPSDMSEAFAELARKCTSSSRRDALIETAERFRVQDDELSEMRNLLNRNFEANLRGLVIAFAREAFRPTECLERAQMTQLCYDGFTVQMKTADLLESAVMEDPDAGIRRRLSEVSLLFDPPCNSNTEVEDRILKMCLEATGTE